MIYFVQYREENSMVWNKGPSQVYSPNISNIWVGGLNPGRYYEFRVVLIDETREPQDPSLSKPVKAQTKCLVTKKQEFLHVNITTNTSISLSWDNETGPRNTECPTRNYLLEVDKVTDTGYIKTKEVVNIKRNSYLLEMLSPGQTYCVRLKKITINGETVTISNKNITTDDTVDLSKDIVLVTIKKTDSQIKIDWFPMPLYKTYFVKYKLVRYMSCNEDNTKSTLEVKETPNTTLSLSLLDLEPYAYYQLFVTADKNQMIKEFNSSFITPGTVPTDSPTLSSDPKVTNESIHLFLTNYSDYCEYMNGVFKEYKIKLYDYSQELIRESYEKQTDKLDITGLQSESQYSVKIYFVNHVGFNANVGLEHKFTTKPNTLDESSLNHVGFNANVGLEHKFTTKPNTLE
ncbi:hypothetical protein WDU94_005972 [Cyamophila willieti]